MVTVGAICVGAKRSVLEVEALAVLHGVEMALESSITSFMVESDSATAVNLTANSVAHGLVKFVLQVSGNLVWMKDVLSSIALLVSEDARFRL
ncbi:hypothetical protein ACOSQ3_014489 [Xanthoceras sorbifolium]